MMWCRPVPGALREGAVKYGRAPADQAPPPLPPLCDVSQARHVIRALVGFGKSEARGEGRV